MTDEKPKRIRDRSKSRAVEGELYKPSPAVAAIHADYIDWTGLGGSNNRSQFLEHMRHWQAELIEHYYPTMSKLDKIRAEHTLSRLINHIHLEKI